MHNSFGILISLHFDLVEIGLPHLLLGPFLLSIVIELVVGVLLLVVAAGAEGKVWVADLVHTVVVEIFPGVDFVELVVVEAYFDLFFVALEIGVHLLVRSLLLGVDFLIVQPILIEFFFFVLGLADVDRQGCLEVYFAIVVLPVVEIFVCLL